MLALALPAYLTASCITSQDSFVGDRELDLCDAAYYICGVPASCVLDDDHYVAGAFPGIRRVVVATADPATPVQVGIFFTVMQAPGSELVVQLFEADCTLDTLRNRALLQDVDVFDEAGDDQTLLFDFVAAQPGEHLIELYADASAEYLLVVTVGDGG